MAPETYFRIVLLMLARDSAVLGFSLMNFLENGGKKILINSAAQYVGYVSTKAVANNITPDMVFPVIVNSKIAVNFLQVTNKLPGQPETVATVAGAFTIAGLLARNTDIPTNALTGGLIAAFADYMASVVTSGKVPFAYYRPKRLNLTFKQHMKMEILLLGSLFAIAGCFIIIIYFTKTLIKRSRLFFKKSIKTIKNFRLKRLTNSNKKLVKWVKIEPI